MSGSDYFIEPLTERELDILGLLAEGLSNREIAQRLVIAPGTVKWYNKQIYSKLNVHSREDAVAKSKLVGLLQTQSTVPEYRPSAVKHNLPAQITSFVGRQNEIHAIKQLLVVNRLLTLSGPPGTGKTRLALQIATEILDRFKDGIFFIELAPIKDTKLVLTSIAQALDIQEGPRQPLIDTLTQNMRKKQMMLFLDNFEQVIEAAPLVGDLLSACPGLRVLVTSREPLRVYGEQEYPVPPLAVPDREYNEPLPVISKYEAVELFSQRARAVKPDFILSEANAAIISEICMRLDGLPLAIELAAARSKLLSPESICERLENRFQTLTGGARGLPARLQTLRAAIDWSYDLLDADEKLLFERQSVFQGGRTLEAIESICDSDLSFTVLDGIESLLNKNLLYSEEGNTGETRFYMLETIHEYAREKLAQNEDTFDLKKRHALYFVALAERAEAEYSGIKQGYWYARLMDELDNIRTVLNWSLESENIELGARIVAALREFWYWKGFFISESAIWIERAFKTEIKISPAVRAKTLNAYSRFAFAYGDHIDGERYARQALTIARDINDQELCAWALDFLSAHLTASHDRIGEAMTYIEEAYQIFRALDHKFGMVFALNLLGEISRMDGDYHRAGRYYEECLMLSDQIDDRQRKAISLGNLSYVAYHQGEYDQAVDYSKRALILMESLEMEYMIAIGIAMMAGPVGARGDLDRAVRYLAASEEQLKSMGASIQPADKIEIDQVKNEFREKLGKTEYDKAWAEGQAMSLEQVFAMVVGESGA